MKPKVKSLLYFICFLGSIMLYYSTSQTEVDTLTHKDTVQLAQHDVNKIHIEQHTHSE